jgi:hypothetical protein
MDRWARALGLAISDCTLFIAHFTLHIWGGEMGRDGPHYNCSDVRVGRFPEPERSGPDWSPMKNEQCAIS